MEDKYLRGLCWLGVYRCDAGLLKPVKDGSEPMLCFGCPACGGSCPDCTRINEAYYRLGKAVA